MHTIDAGESTIMASRLERAGNGYYPVDDSYDRRMYINDTKNYVRIVFTLIFFWTVMGLNWWGVFELGINAPEVFMLYSIIIFVVTVFFGIGLLISGSIANKKKRFHEFLIDKISDKKAVFMEAETKRKQEAAYAAKMAKQKAEAEANAAT